MAQEYVALAIQGMVLDQKAVAIGVDQEAMQKLAAEAAAALNVKMTGEEEGYVGIVALLER